MVWGWKRWGWGWCGAGNAGDWGGVGLERTWQSRGRVWQCHVAGRGSATWQGVAVSRGTATPSEDGIGWVWALVGQAGAVGLEGLQGWPGWAFGVGAGWLLGSDDEDEDEDEDKFLHIERKITSG